MITKLLYITALLLLICDLFIQKHPHFSWEHYPGFYAGFGFASSVFLVLVAKYILQKLLIREEDYYD